MFNVNHVLESLIFVLNVLINKIVKTHHYVNAKNTFSDKLDLKHVKVINL
jgi:hypothetical protein